MKSINIFSRVFISAIIGTVICLAIGAYATDLTISADPQIFKKIEDKYNVRISKYSISKRNVNEHEDSWNFAMPISKISIMTTSANYRVSKADGEELIIKVRGTADDRTDTLLKLKQEGDSLSIEDNTDVSDLKVRIEIPASFNVQNFEADIVNGSLKLDGVSFQNLEFNSVSGQVKADDISAKSIQGKTISGEIKINNLVESSIILETTSGNIRLELPDDHKAAYSLMSISGNISKEGGVEDSNSPNKVSIKSISGNIKIK